VSRSEVPAGGRARIVVGPGVAELLHAATITVTGETPVHRLWHALPCFPSISEVWLYLLTTYRDHNPPDPRFADTSGPGAVAAPGVGPHWPFSEERM
jgi:hypothetical protein